MELFTEVEGKTKDGDVIVRVFQDKFLNNKEQYLEDFKDHPSWDILQVVKTWPGIEGELVCQQFIKRYGRSHYYATKDCRHRKKDIGDVLCNCGWTKISKGIFADVEWSESVSSDKSRDIEYAAKRYVRLICSEDPEFYSESSIHGIDVKVLDMDGGIHRVHVHGELDIVFTATKDYSY